MANNKVKEIVTERIIRFIEENDKLPWSVGYNTAPPQSYVRKNHYHGTNYLLTLMRGFSSPYWFTFKDVQKIEGRIRKGEAGTVVVYYNIREFEKEDPETGETYLERIPFMRYYRVWNLAQLDPGHGIDENVPVVRESAEAIVAACAPTLTFGKTPQYKPGEDSIGIPPIERYADSDRYYEALFHELIHWTGHKSRCNREMKPHSMDRGSYALEELVAEIGCAMLCHLCGIPVSKNQAAYVKGWLEALNNDKGMIITAANRAQTAVDYIMSLAKPDVEGSRKLNHDIDGIMNK